MTKMYALRNSVGGFSGGTRVYPTGANGEYVVYHSDDNDKPVQSKISVSEEQVVKLRDRTR